MHSVVKRLIIISCLVLMACPDPSKPDGGEQVCDVMPPDVCKNPALRFADVQPLFEKHCVNCHYGQLGGPWPLRSYMDIADWHDVVLSDIAFCSMPPADAGTGMTTAEKQLILDWLRCDFPE
jgi:uncharacterized membrane protein